jgi:uncharacterized membrane protein
LLFFGVINVLVGLSMITPGPREEIGEVIDHIMPADVFGLVWITIGITCFIQSFMRKDVVAFAAAMLIMVSYGFMHLLAWYIGNERGWLSAGVYFIYSAFIGVISGWPEPTAIRDERNGN